MGPGSSPHSRRRGLALVAAVCAVFMVACAGRQGGSGDGAKTVGRVIVLRDAVVAAGTSELPFFATIRVVPDGTASYADRVSSLLAGAESDGPVAAVVAIGARKGLVEAVRKSRAGAGRPPIWILVSPADDSLEAEAAADLVVQVDPTQASDASFEQALERGLCELARRVSIGGARIDNAAEIAAALRSAGGWSWKVSYRVDPATRVKARNDVILEATRRG